MNDGQHVPLVGVHLTEIEEKYNIRGMTAPEMKYDWKERRETTERLNRVYSLRNQVPHVTHKRPFLTIKVPFLMVLLTTVQVDWKRILYRFSTLKLFQELCHFPISRIMAIFASSLGICRPSDINKAMYDLKR